MLRRMLLMIQFYTVIPIPIDLKATELDYGRGMAYAPIAGMLVGCVAAAAYWLGGLIGDGVLSSVAAMAAYAYFTGALHIDGLGDTADGLLSCRSAPRMLEIMRDSRVGIHGVVAVVFVLLLDMACIYNIDSFIYVFFMPVIGRFASTLSCAFSRYARPGEGMGRSFIDHCGWVEAVLSGVFTLAAGYTIMGAEALVYMVFTAVFVFLFVHAVGRKIGGMTGDTCGAACELSQTVFLVTLLAFRAAKIF